MDVHAYPTSPTTFMRRTPRLIKKILLDRRYDHLFKARWDGHLVNYLPLIYRYGISMNILHLTFFFVQDLIILCKLLIITGISNEKTS